MKRNSQIISQMRKETQNGMQVKNANKWINKKKKKQSQTSITIEN